MSFISIRVYNIQIKNFSRIPLIKFRGSKLIQNHHSQAPLHQPLQTFSVPVNNTQNIVDNHRAVEASIRYRSQISAEEIETINSGYPLKIGNWQKIKLKSKK